MTKTHISDNNFVINNGPNTDELTLKKFFELMNTSGSFGMVQVEQILGITQWVLKNLPNADLASLITVLELLGIWVPLEGYE